MRRKGFTEIGKDLTDEVNRGTIYRTNRHIKEIVIHCSASPQGRGDTVHDVDSWHLSPPNSWKGCGYHVVILEDGTLQKGRDFDDRGSHAKGYNRSSLAACRIGGYNNKMDATPEQEEAIVNLCYIFMKQYGVKPKDIKGHGELPRVKKSCPLMDMDRIREILDKK